jgi:Cu+-exporting ATPase
MKQPKPASKAETPSARSCYHCGDVCASDALIFQEKDFCCHGCKSVFELLQSCDLEGYYQYAENPGIKSTKTKVRDAFAYLDNQLIREQLLSFSSDELAKVTLKLPAMHCTSCIWLVENLHKLFKGVINSRVNFVQRKATVTFNPQIISLRSLVEKLDGIGYEPELNLESVGKKKASTHTRRIIFQLGVAGFCFGNIMLLSFPEYLSGAEVVDETYRKFFGYLNFTLGLPVLLFSASDYLRSGWISIMRGRLNMDVPISLGILALFGRSTFEIFFQGGGGYMDSLAALVFFLLIGKWFQQKTYDSLSFERDYRSYFPISVQRIEEGVERPCGIELLQPGDTFRIRSGELIPCDAALVSGSGLVDYSFVSGESEPVQISAGQKVFAGGRQKGSAVLLQVQKSVDQSYLTGLWNETEGGEASYHLEVFADKVGRRFTIAVLVISAITATYWLFTDPIVAWNAVSAVLIVACPCALALSFPFAFGNAVRILGRRGLYLKNAQALGHMAEVTDIVFDKTGTLTRSGNAQVSYEGTPLAAAQRDVVYTMVSQSGHPLSRYIFRKLRSKASDAVIEAYQEHTGKGLEAWSSGDHYKLGSAEFTGPPNRDADPLTSEIHLSINGLYQGKFLVHKSYRTGLSDIMHALQRQFKLYLLSGDNDADRGHMAAVFGKTDDLHFYQSPHDKKAFLKKLREGGASTAMIGDGLNDAGALREADFGISVADDVFRFAPACDAILASDSFEDLHRFFAFSKGALKVVKWSLVFSFMYNAIGIFFAVQGLLEPVIAAILMPVSSITVVGFVTLGTSALSRKHF